MDNNNEWMDFISVIKKKYRMILLFTAIVCFITVVVTFFIPKEYVSSAVIFPTDTNSLDDVLKNPQFGYDIEADRLIQILQSRPIRDSIVKKFNLLNYYKIDNSEADRDYYLKKEYDKDVTFAKTMYMSVVISVRTRDPEMSSNIVNSIVALVGKDREALLKQNIILARNALQSEYENLKLDLDSLSATLNYLTNSGKNIKQYVQNDRSISLIFDKDQMSNDASGKAIQLVVNQYNVKLSWFYDVQNKLKAANLMLRRPLPAVYVVESAVPSYKKSYPRYGTNLLIAFISSIVFISFFSFFLEKIKILRGNLKKYEVSPVGP